MRSCHCSSRNIVVFWTNFWCCSVVASLDKEKNMSGNFTSEFSEDWWRSCNYQCSLHLPLSHTCTHHPFSLRWRDAEEQWNLRRLILTLFYYSPSLASELSRISMGLHSLSWWKDSCAAESLFTPRSRGPLEYTTSPFTSMLTSEPSKINQKEPDASHLLISCSLALSETTCWIKKRHFFEDWQPCLNLPPMMTFWQTSQEQFSLPCAVFFLFFSVNMNLYIFTHYHTIRSALRMLICTSINSYLKDKSKHVCFLFVFFSSSQLPKGIYEHFGNKDQRRI